ncbi:serine/threonine-protein kinase [Streptomyces sp. V4-01]|uniref:non-specific serine/threonine protein kinase n=1 Tax=Actinacidiphila polyblastidii TaxID=3110430 RepID=A0ABU7P5F7_9ACTN|nr:serine/threonine-protein kinase [Streptomyces sp. V4-01]
MGEVFAGRYELVDPIGRGGVGAVWRSWDHRRRRYVAAKVLQQVDAHALLRFVREQAMRIDHPHVLAPASWAADDDKVLFTMGLVHGGSLSHLIGDYGPLPPRYVGVLLDQLLAGLSAVHAEGVVHRDIKPANILLEATGTGTPHVRLSDFGIAMRKGEARLTETNYVVGTPGYFAPEQLLGAEPDFPADLYAVGLVALYLLSGRKPDAQAIVERYQATGTPSAPQGVPEPLWQVIAALLQPDPHARFRTATGARKALAAAVELLPEPAPGEEPVEIFDQIGPLPEGFGPQGPLAAAQTAPAVPRPVPVPLPTPVPVPTPVPAPQPVAALRPEGAGQPGAAAPAPAAAPAQEPVQEPAPAPPPAAEPLPEPSLARPDAAPQPPGPPAPPGRRPQGRHAAPLPAHEPITHTRTRADGPEAGARPLPLPLPQHAARTAPAAAPAPAHPDPHAARSPAAGADTASARLPARAGRGGPPARIVIPMLVLAVICFAVGLLALAAS